MLTLTRGHWYGWQMLPGYCGKPYYSPIRIQGVTTLKTGRGEINIEFFNAFYAEGAQSFNLKLKILRRTTDYIVSDLIEYSEERMAIITNLTPRFIIKHSDRFYVNENIELIQNSDPQTLMDRMFRV